MSNSFSQVFFLELGKIFSCSLQPESKVCLLVLTMERIYYRLETKNNYFMVTRISSQNIFTEPTWKSSKEICQSLALSLSEWGDS